jgi:hypothetical protein
MKINAAVRKPGVKAHACIPNFSGGSLVKASPGKVNKILS